MDMPEAPDPQDTASAQMQGNVQAAIASQIMSNYNQEGPLGEVKYKKIGNKKIVGPSGEIIKVPKYKQVTKLSPNQKRLFESGQQASQKMADLGNSQIDRVSESLGKPLDFSTLPERNTDWSADRQRVEQAMFDRLNPEFDRDEGQARARLASQGLTPGSEGYDEELDRLEDVKGRTRLDIIAAGGNEQSRLFGMNETARANAISEMMTERTQPLNEITALLSGTQVQMPQAYTPYQQGIDSAPIGDYITGNYEQEMQAYNNMMNNMFGLGRTAMSGMFGLAG